MAGLFIECKKISKQLGVEAIRDAELSAHNYRKTVTESCHAEETKHCLRLLENTLNCQDMTKMI